jgi:uncharacterized protein CbrC (UPF0167 family)
MTTFTDLGVAVPLFLGDVRFVEGLADARTCALCGQVGPCLPLEDVPVPCPNCGDPTLVRRKTRAADRHEPCQACQTRVTLDGVLATAAADALRRGVPTKLRGCVGCLRAGRWAQTHDTEVGTVGWERSASPAWRSELVGTPRYATFQGEEWLFCHDLPMAFLGEWGQEEFEDARPGAGQALFEELVDLEPEAWELGLESEDLRVYAFRCQQCDRVRAHTDTD